jgi:hypothetical protein
MAENGTVEGQSFRNEALTGSGTILPDGTYGEPLPDPTEVRGLGPDKTSGGRVASLVSLNDIPEELIVDKANSTADKGEEPKQAPAAKKATGSTSR